MFNLKNYPKSYGNIKIDFYRLSYFNKNQAEMEKIESIFLEFINKQAQTVSPIKNFKNYPFINSGWEWSVFKKNDNSVIKVPAQIFSEVSDKKYLENTEFAYKKISEFFPARFLVKTSFKRVNSLNTITQEYINGEEDIDIIKSIKNKVFVSNLKSFLNCSLLMLEKYDWLPDLSIQKTDNGFKMRNLVFQNKDLIPKIIDFTSYYDVFRLHPQRTNLEAESKKKQIQEVVSWLDLEI